MKDLSDSFMKWNWSKLVFNLKSSNAHDYFQQQRHLQVGQDRPQKKPQKKAKQIALQEYSF